MRNKILKTITYLTSFSLVASALFIAYIVLFPVDVLQNWTLRTTSDRYTLGQSVVIESLFTKKVNTGKNSKASRYIECKNSNGVYVRYLLSEATANREKSKSTGTGIVVYIPKQIAEVDLPTDCFFSISIDYDVYPRRADPEYQRTKNFILSKPATTAIESSTNNQIVSNQPINNQTPTTQNTNITNNTTMPSTVAQTPTETVKPVEQTCIINLIGIKVFCN